MNWQWQQIFTAALAVLVAIVSAVLLSQLTVVVRQMPSNGPMATRIWAGVRRTPILSSALALFILALIGVVWMGFATGVSTVEPPPSAVAGSAQSPAPSSRSEGDEMAVAGWGPGRTVATADNRPSAPMPNSLLDHPDYGDERNFFRVKMADAPDATFKDDVIAEAGKVYEFVVLVNNDARAGAEPLRNVRLRIQMPGLAKQSAASQVFLTSTNNSPEEIWDGVNLVGEVAVDQFALRYVTASAVIHTGGDADGTILSDDVFENGVTLGCDHLDGTVPSGTRCQAYVSFKIRIDKPNFAATALARVGKNSWSQTSVAAVGAQATIAVTYRNTGTTQQDGIVMRVNLPDNFHYVAGSTMWINARNGRYIPGLDGIAESGINVGSYAPGANVAARFTITMDKPPSTTPTMQTVEKFLTVETRSGNKTAPLSFAWLE